MAEFHLFPIGAEDGEKAHAPRPKRKKPHRVVQQLVSTVPQQHEQRIHVRDVQRDMVDGPRVLPKERDTFCMDRMSIGGSLLSVNDIILPKKKQSCYKNAVKGASQTANGALRGMNGAETIAVFRRRPFISAGGYPLMPEVATPSVRYFCIKAKIRKMGTSESVDIANSAP